MTQNTDHSQLIAFLDGFNALGKGLFEEPFITNKQNGRNLPVYSTCEIICALAILLHCRTANYTFYCLYDEEGPYLKCLNLPKY